MYSCILQKVLFFVFFHDKRSLLNIMFMAPNTFGVFDGAKYFFILDIEPVIGTQSKLAELRHVWQ